MRLYHEVWPSGTYSFFLFKIFNDMADSNYGQQVSLFGRTSKQSLRLLIP
jgi:hypothetical protein